jgi:RNA polymerase sigma factor for flagellar operon FliA
MTAHIAQIPSTVDRPHNGPVSSGFRLRELWRRHREGDEAVRENLVLHYAPLVKVVAGRVGGGLPPHVEQGDLIAYGLTGLIEAIDRYDPERGVKFKTFALLRIRGAMIDALRRLDWVPRKVRQNAREIEQVEAGLGARLGRVPTETELSDRLGLDLETLRGRLREIADARLYSFDAPQPGRRDESVGGDTSLLDLVSSPGLTEPQEALDAAEETRDLRGVLSGAIGDLPERQQFVLACRYREDLRLGEIGEVMGISESRVSQLHTKALISLRAVLGAARDPGGRGPLRLVHSCG